MNSLRRPFHPTICRSDLSVAAPPTYAECIEGSVDIGDDEEGEVLGDTHFTPMYAYVHDYLYQPPPAYSEVSPRSVSLEARASQKL